jgi:hypothetical protein
MPAIQPARLKKQTSELATKFCQPVLFVRELHALLNLYTDHTHRAGQTGEPSPLLGSYNAPLPVMRQVWHDLTPMIRQYPDDILPLCDALWAEPYYDHKLLSSRLLGQVPLDPPDQVINRLQTWICQDLDNLILDGLLEFGLKQLQQDSPGILLALVSSWLMVSDHISRVAGMRALLPLIKSLGSENFPAIFRMLVPFVRIAPSSLRPDIIAVLTSLAHYSPAETAFFLRQNLSAPDNPDTAWLVRQVLNEFPQETQAGLRQAMKGLSGV